MPRPTGTIVENNFSKGLITEATPLTFPQNAITEGFNIVINRNGSIERRLGFNREDGGSSVTVGITNAAGAHNTAAITSFLWKSVGGDGDVNFLVIQIGYRLHYWVVPATGILSANKKSFTTSLLSFDLATPDNRTCQFASGDGKLFVTHPRCEPFYVTYNSTGDTISETQITVKIRDFEGVDDNLGIEERPNTLSDAHEYNLYNQGWFMDEVLTDPTGNITDPPITFFETAVLDYPSNADIWWLFKNTEEAFDPGEAAFSIARGNTPAPKGHFILDAFNTARSSADVDIGTVTETSAGTLRPRTVAFFAGRVWLSGIEVDGYGSNVYFTQIIERAEQYDFFYQVNDPTSESQSDLLPSDGGVIKIQDTGTIYKLFPLQDKLLILSSTGIWAITGSQGTGFTANDFAVQKISGVSVLNADNIVDVEGLPFFWNHEGIFAVQPDNVGNLTVQSLTQKSIQTFYDDIKTISKKFAQGAYDPVNKLVQWCYRTTSPSTINERYQYNRILVLDLNLGCFYYYTFTTDYIRSIASVSNPLGDPDLKNTFYYLAVETESNTELSCLFLNERMTTYVDFTLISPEAMTSYFITGYKITDLTKDFQNNYVYFYVDNEQANDASLLVQGLWDFTRNDNSRFSTQQEVFDFASGHAVSKTRKKIRGHGKSLQLKFTSSPNKPFRLFGWVAYVTSNMGP